VATESTVADTVHSVANMVNFLAGFGDKSATTWIRQLVSFDTVANSVDFVADIVNFVASEYGAKATFNKVDRVEFNFVANMYWA